MYPLTVKEISNAHKADIKLKLLLESVLPKGVTLQTVEDINVFATINRMIIPKPVQKGSVSPLRAAPWTHSS